MIGMHVIAVRAERLVYRVAALPIAFWAAMHFDDGLVNPVRQAFAWRYWHPEGLYEWLELAFGLTVSPFALAIAILWFTARNGPSVRRRRHKGLWAQAADQLRLYWRAGILAPWYYIFSLYRDGDVVRARSFLQRSETKWGVFYLLRVKHASPLSDKKKFADRCLAHGVRCVDYVAYFDGGVADRAVTTLPDTDLFVKPANGRGGKGAERWDRVAPRVYAGAPDAQLDEHALVDRLRKLGRSRPMLVQRRMLPHPSISDLTSGALPTVRVLTCLNENGEAAVMAAVFRMSIGRNRTVDNIHAGDSHAAFRSTTAYWGPRVTWEWMPALAGSTDIPTPMRRSPAARCRCGKRSRHWRFGPMRHSMTGRSSAGTLRSCPTDPPWSKETEARTWTSCSVSWTAVSASIVSLSCSRTICASAATLLRRRAEFLRGSGFRPKRR